jgi:hypothetical protein
MTAGLPGAGIGGLFYFCLVLLMPLREIYLTALGRSSLARWKLVAFQYSMLAGIFIALWAEAWMIKSTLEYLQTIDGWFGRSIEQLTQFTGFMMLTTGQLAAVASLVTLGGVCLAAAALNVAARAGWIKTRKAIPAYVVE